MRAHKNLFPGYPRRWRKEISKEIEEERKSVLNIKQWPAKLVNCLEFFCLLLHSVLTSRVGTGSRQLAMAGFSSIFLLERILQASAKWVKSRWRRREKERRRRAKVNNYNGQYVFLNQKIVCYKRPAMHHAKFLTYWGQIVARKRAIGSNIFWKIFCFPLLFSIDRFT